jgi:uncharacterized membrane protein
MLRILFNLVHGVSTPFILRVLGLLHAPLVDDPAFSGYIAPVIGLVATLSLIVLVGLSTANFLGQRIVREFDRLMLRIPVIKAIYGGTRQLLDALDSKNSNFQRVVMVEYPRTGVYTIGFLAKQDATLVVSEKGGSIKGHSLVFLPTTPNPTSGWLAAVPAREVIPLEMSIEEGIKTIVSGGLVIPPGWERR